MASVQTVRGPVDTGELGTTLMHEHVFVLTADVQQNFPTEWGEEDERVADAVTKLTAMAEVGVDTIVDPTVIGLGRYLPRIARINEQVDLNIIVATGIYTYETAPAFFRFRGPGVIPGTPDPMVEMFVHDLTEGVADTGVQAAFLKCAIDEPGLTADVGRIMRAVAQASVETGAPVTVHTHPGSETGAVVHDIMSAEGVPPGRVVLGHSGDSGDVDHLSGLAEHGYFLGMDRFGIDLVPFDQRVDTVAELCGRGYAERMVLSHDASCYIDWIDPTIVSMMTNWHYTHIHDDVLPALRERGVTDEQITTMLVDNPRRYFEPVAS